MSVGAAIAGTNYRVLMPLPSHTHAWSDRCCVLHVDVEVVSIASVARYTHVAGIQVEQAALAFAGNGFGDTRIPAQAVVQGQGRGNSPLVLSIEEPPLLPLGSGGVLNDGAKESVDITQQKRGEAYTYGCPCRR